MRLSLLYVRLGDVGGCRSRVDGDEFDLKDEGGATGDLGGRAVFSVGKGRLDGELADLSRAHVDHPAVPTLDDLALAESKLKGRATVAGRVELFSRVLQRPDVVDSQLVSLLALPRALVLRHPMFCCR